MSEPTISVIIPIYNVGPFLEQCLESIRNQTFDDLEIICLNDGSTDDSLQIIQRYAAVDKRIIVVDKKNEGYGATCNRGIDLAAGKWISIIEPDDFLSANFYQKLVSFAESISEPIDIVKSGWMDVYAWNDPGTTIEKHCSLHKRVKTSKKPFRLEDEPLLIEGHPSIWSALYARDFLDAFSIRFHPYPGAGWADNPFLIDTMAQARAVVFLDECLYHYRVELPAANQPTEAAIRMPSERWAEMTRRLGLYGVSDQEVWKAHYVRGFNNLEQMAGKLVDGWDNPTLLECARNVFSQMDEGYVMRIGKLSPAQKQRYRTVMDLPEKRVSKLPYLISMAERAIHKISSDGLK